jgi:hypothetical protein
MLRAAANVATIIIVHSTNIILFMACLIFEDEIVAAAFSTTATRVD